MVCNSSAMLLFLLILPLWFSHLCLSFGQPTPDFGDLDMGKPCFNFRCTAGSTPVPKSRMKFKSTGCSGIGSGGMMMMSKGGVDNNEPYSDCCDQWHACYSVCGAPKKACDDTFFSCAEEACLETPDAEQCNKDVQIKRLMINMSGCSAYDQGQYAACECVPNSKASAKGKEAIRYFYKKYAPDQLSKVDGLAEKIGDSTQKLAGLIRKLLAKYPVAIVKEKDPNQAMFDEILENTKERQEDSSDIIDESDETQEL